MKLSFSTKGWYGKSFEEFCEIAKELRFSGIELQFEENDGTESKTEQETTHNRVGTRAVNRTAYGNTNACNRCQQ